ncbi:TonB-dependent receptor [Flavobacterium akiainvivens]|uniref:TonB-dependent receptor n=1 Tax=Flavobacterium akiainvivens TaxID=1202724 RepID=A0A0N0RQZ8_9FLAO|nr:TonB-dependent receptor [Flavobacterium akiainvivens]KOS07522.1 TonB-dependent receptor [Flavobacterium akiainvivens]SFQ63970.1 TonB-linked outer membrane protein, SusC/RagA family [Flavobacterium akiainvivens]
MRNITSKNGGRWRLLLCTSLLFSGGGAFAAPLVTATSTVTPVQTIVMGTVKSAEDNMPVPGITVMIKGTNTVAVTDIDGSYQINVDGPDAVLVFTGIGFATQEIVVGSQSTIDVTLAADAESLEEVVVVGYGTKKKATVTGSISEIDGKAIVKSPAVNVSNGFAGRVSGVIASNRAGEPGYDDSSISIRGLATTGNNDVLIVVDGVPGQIGGLNRLNPREIESITVLKDASAAIYGSRAANGVILVTTKKGKKGERLTVNYSFDQGFSSPTRLPDMADAATYAEITNEINPGTYTAQDIELFRNGTDPIMHPNTDWAKATLRDYSLQSQHNLSLQGGSENTNYFLSLGKVSQEGLYKNSAASYDQYNVRTNFDANIGSRLKVGISLNGRKEDRMFPVTGAGGIFRAIYRAYPTVAAFYPNGLPTSGIENGNPALLATSIGGTNENPAYVVNGILRGSFDIGAGFSVDGFFSADISEARSKSFSTPYTVYTYNQTTQNYDPRVVGGGANQKGDLNESQTSQSLEVSNIKLNFKEKFGAHNIDAFIGYEQSENKYHTFNARKINFPTTTTPELGQGGAAATDATNGGYSSNFTRQSYISRIAYDYAQKYLLEFQARVDGSSNFPSGNRFGFFTSVSGGYRISEEEWFKNSVGFFDDLKFRASYGELGNDNIGNFQYFDNYSFNNRYVIGNTVTSGIDLIKLANPNITWEVSKKTDLAINAKFLKGFTFEGIYFQQNRSDILAPRNASVPGSTGIVNPYGSDPLVPAENIGKVKSHGYEVTLGYDHQGEEFSWGVSGNFTYAKNKVIFIDEAPGLLDYQSQTGHPMNTYLLYNAIGIFRSEADLAAYPHVTGATVGDLIYEDYNNDGQITADDMVRSKYGNIPQMTFGLVADVSYKNFDLSVVLSGQAQVSQYVLPESGTVGNYYSSWADNRWTPSNPDASYPKVSDRSSSAISGGQYRNNFWLNDASFVRLKNIQVGYTVPSSFLEEYGISNFRVYASAFNLFTISKVKDYDPEGNNESAQFYPQQKIINLGFNVQF